jgi:hypothetical protein
MKSGKIFDFVDSCGDMGGWEGKAGLMSDSREYLMGKDELMMKGKKWWWWWLWRQM